MKNLVKYLLTTLFLAVLPVLGFAGGGWSGEERGSIDRANPENYTWTVLAAASGTTGDVIDMDTIMTTSLETGDTISASSVTPPNGVRTLCVRFVEASGDDAVLKLRITGRDQFGRQVRSDLNFESSGVLVTDAAFAPYPEPVFYVRYASGLASEDSLYVNSYGQALYSNPQKANDIREFLVNGTQLTYTDSNFALSSGTSTPSSSVSYFTTKFSTWNPDTGHLPTAFMGSVVGATTAQAAEVPALTSLRIWNALATNLGAAGTSDDLGLSAVGSTMGTDLYFQLTTADLDNNDAANPYYGSFLYTMPKDYVSGGAVTIVASAGSFTTKPDVSLTMDFEAIEYGTPGTDIVATAAQNINGGVADALNNYTFTVTPTNLVAGDTLLIRANLTGRDDTAAAATYGRIVKVTINSLRNTTTANTVAAGLVNIQMTPNTTSYGRSTVVFGDGDGVGGELLTEEKSVELE